MSPNREKRNDFHRYLCDRFGMPGEALYMGVLGFIAIFINGGAAYLLKYPLLFPSLAPTVFHIFRSPLDAGASPRNTITGHFVGLIVGFISLAVFGLLNTPSVIQEGATLPHIWAAALSLAVAEGILISFNRPHPPAAATTLLVSLGIFKSFTELLSLAGGILLLTITCWILNRSLGVPVPLWSPRDPSED